MNNKLYKQRGVHHKTIVLYVLLFVVSFSFAQVGVGNTDPQATLDITASNQATPSNEDGILIPRVDTFPGTDPTAAQQGMLIYLTTAVGTNPKGFYYWDDGSPGNWVRLSNIERVNDLFDGKSDVGGATPGSSIFIGIEAGENDDATDNNNVGVGYRTLRLNTAGNHNSALGYTALANNEGNNNSAFGFTALQLNTSGVGNSAFGKRALEDNTTGNHNTAMGADALRNNYTSLADPLTTGTKNTAVGNGAMFTNTLGSENVAIGNQALYANLTGVGNTAIGAEALFSDTTAPDASRITANTAVGYHASHQNVDGERNTSLGYEALSSNVTQNNNSAFGHGALSLNSSGNNTAMGSFAGNESAGNSNVFLGVQAGNNRLSGNENVFVGIHAGRGEDVSPATTTGGENVYLGKNAGRGVTGSSNVFIGYHAGYDNSFDTTSNTLLIQNKSDPIPLIYGEFDNSKFRVNGELQIAEPGVTNGYAFPTVDGTVDQILVTDGSGQLTFEDQQTIPVVPDVSTFTMIRATFIQPVSPAPYVHQALGTTGWQKIEFDAVDFDITSSGEFKTGTNRFEPDNDGVYRIDASFQTTTSQANTDYYGIAVYINGDLYQEFSANHYYNLTDSSQVARQISCVLNLVDSDYVEIFAHNTHNATSPVVVAIEARSTKTHFTIERIR